MTTATDQIDDVTASEIGMEVNGAVPPVTDALTYPMPVPMQERIMERNEELQRCRIKIDEDIELARRLSGAPEGYILRDVREGFVPQTGV